ncbi:MAG: Rne/Rng family ribonuclease [Zavarzinia sp.]|nr:Rne/Rng family ribonuclease [Zavarzinia sp.]
MATRMLIDATHPEETRVVVVRGNRLEEFDFESANKKQLKGNIYLAKVTRVEPSLQAAFVEYGGNRHGFLAFSEIHPDYYQIPVADRQALLDEEAAAHADDDDDDDIADVDDAGDDSAGDIDDDSGLIEVVEVDTATEVVGAGSGDDEDGDGSRLGADNEFEDPVLEGDPETLKAIDAETSEGGPAPLEIPAPVEAPAPAEEPIPAVAEAAPAEIEQPVESAPAEAEAVVETAPAVEPTPEAEAPEAAVEVTGIPVDAVAEVQPVLEPTPVPAVAEIASPAMPAAETETEYQPRPRFRPRRSYKIQEVIKRRQIMLVQVVKEERGNKGAALTTYLSLAGRYCVLMPNSPRGGGISRKIQNPADRKRLKSITSELELPKGMSVIVRTAGLNRTKPEIKRDYEYLVRMWDSVRELTLQSAAPALVYEEGNLIKRAIRDLYSKDIEEIQVDGEEGYRQAKDFMRMLIPSHAKNVQLYRDRVPLFHRAQIENQLDQMFNPTVHLRSGGYIVINPTEALVSIDVNSGRATREHNIEETATKTNLEAAEEIARQLRLRDLAGLVVIDFIDMEDQRNARAVERKMKDCLKTDRARIQIGRISPFGLLEMSRQRLRPSLLEASTVTCPHCRGVGLMRSTESTALHVLRGIEDEGMRERASKIAVKIPEPIALYIFNHKRDALRSLEERYDFKIYVEIDPELIAPDYRIERLANRSTPVPEAVLAIRSGTFPMPDLEEEDPVEAEIEPEVEAEAEVVVAVAPAVAAETAEGDGKKPRRRRRRRRGKDREAGEGPREGETEDGDESAEDGEAPAGTDTEGENEGDAAPSAEPTEAEGDSEDGAEGTEGESEGDAEGDGRRRRRRGRRGGRRRRGDGPEGENAEGEGAEATGVENAAGDEAAAPVADSDAEPARVTTIEIEVAAAPESPVADVEIAAEPVPEIPEVFPAAHSPDAEGTDIDISPEAQVVGSEAVAPVNKPVETIVSGDRPESSEPPQPPRRGWWQRRFNN